MREQTRPGFHVILTSLIATCALTLSLVTMAGAQAATSRANTAQTHKNINCAVSTACTEVQDSEEVFGEGKYVGHDEPSTLFYSNQPGSGNQMAYTLKLPTDPTPGPGNVPGAGQSFNFQLHPAFWFGMAMCATQSYPLQVNTCTPDSDSNIFDGQDAAHPMSQHPGTAFMEMQFYPPGWVSWPAGNSCDPTRWCAALNIDSLAEDPINGTTLNPTCASTTGLEYVNFAFITKNGHAQAPANPVQSTLATFTPNPTQDLFMNSGDTLIVSLRDTAHGLRIDIIDLTSGQAGSMTASAANSFGQVHYDPTGTSCINNPYDFHPMYSTSSEHTRVPWAAHSYNIAFADETGHFDYCDNVDTSVGACVGNEGAAGDQEPADGDDFGCFPANASLLIQVSGCLGTNTGFDGAPYHPVWPDGNTSLHPTSIQFSSPVTGFGNEYSRVAFEADLPRIEAPDQGGNCDRTTGANCTLIPVTDDGQPVNFYPFFSVHQGSHGCTWLLGNDIPGQTTNDFGKNSQFGSLLFLDYLIFGGGGATRHITDNFRNVVATNPCPAI
jgi:hypothetical protein